MHSLRHLTVRTREAPMPSLTIRRTIGAPVSHVWEVFTDIEASESRLSAVERVEMLSVGTFAEGTRWRETRTLYGKSVTEEMTITQLDLHRSYTVGAESGRTSYESRFDFQQVDPATTVVLLTFSADSSGVRGMLGALLWPLMRRKLAKDLGHDMDELARVCEQ